MVMLAAVGAALVSLLALVQWDTPARAEEDGGGRSNPR